MIRTATLGFATAVLLATNPASALDFGDMNAAEREAFGAAIREYLLENPEVLMEAIAVLEARQAEEQAAEEETLVSSNAAALFEDTHSFVGGNPDGDVTIVEFIDYRCSFCRRAHPELAELIRTDGNIRVITKEFPILGPDSMEASRFAISVLKTQGPVAYKEINDVLITHRGGFERSTLAKLARDAGLDDDEILAQMDSQGVTDIIRANRDLGEALRITGTPTFVFGDQMVRGYIPLATMEEVVASLRE